MKGYHQIIICVLTFCMFKVTSQKSAKSKHCDAFRRCTWTKAPTLFVKVPTQKVVCLIRSNTGEPCTMDIHQILKLLPASRDVVLYLATACLTPTQISVNNSLNVTKKNFIFYMQILGRCSISVKALSVWGQATDFRVFYASENTTLLERNRKLKASSPRALENIGTLVVYKSRPRGIPNIFRIYAWPKMAEVLFSNLQLSSIPAKLNNTMPLLQSLEVPHNNFTKPPPFPWCNTTLELPRGLERTPTANHHYQFGTIVNPKLYRRFFDLSYNNIVDLATHEFKGLLNALNLEGNGLKVVGPKCFLGLKGIQVINLRNNELSDLPSHLFQGLRSLLVLRLDNNNISSLPIQLFKNLTNIKRIDLGGNKLGYVPNELFNNLKSCEVLNLNDNQITVIEDDAFPTDSSSLQKINLQNNKITRIPSSLFLQRHATDINLSFNQLTFQDLRNLFKEIDPNTFLYHHRDTASSAEFRLKESFNHISFANNKFSKINVKTLNKTEIILFEFLLQIYTIDMTGNLLECDCHILFLARWIRVLMLKYPRIQRVHFQTWKCTVPGKVNDKPILSVHEEEFKCQKNLNNCPQRCLCYVRAMDEAVVIHCKGRNLTELPSKVPRGNVVLHAENNNIKEIHPHPYLENITALYLTNNDIHVINESTVEKLTRIKILFIDFNKLTSLPENIIDVNFTILALNHNFFKCDCTTKWMKHWLRREATRIQNMENVLCNSENAQGKPIYSLPDNEFVCQIPADDDANPPSTGTEYKIIAMILAGSLVLTFIVFLVIFRYHGEMKVFLFTHFNWHPFDRIDDSDPSKLYDAFVSYSGNDYRWVLNTLWDRLENHDPPYTLCVHDRDFQVGKTIQENIFKSVDQSKRMIMVLSNNFLKSEWCLLEFRAAHRKVLEERTNYIIIILLDDVNMDELDEEIKLYMRTNTYLSVNNKWFWQKLCYAMPHITVKQIRARNLLGTPPNVASQSAAQSVFLNEAYAVP
ncbi:protein toll-like [Stylophora pistillata]|uniref:protein toll-like n=1 Tax=Stylophora pistillata TaxID=50429 RepID=UPI000C0458A0|nr:protein toll-like [Stylophora pistillata]